MNKKIEPKPAPIVDEIVPVMYVGERVHFSGQIVQAFKSKDGTEHFFARTKGVWPFECYKMVNQTMKAVKPERAGDWEPSELVRHEFEQNKVIVTARRLEMRKARDIKKPHQNLIRAVELLRPFYRGLNRNEQRLLTEYLLNEISKYKGKR